jgi:hypothetical protein
MKQITQTPGGRRYVGNDFLAMQDLTLKLTEGFYSQFGNFVLYGCEMTGNNIAAGIVMIDGKACIFAGATGITTPYYVQQVVVNENVPYKIGEGLGYQTYTAQACAANEPGAFRLDNAKRFNQLIATENEYTYIVDSNEALAAWAANAPGNDYSSVLIKKGIWTLHDRIYLDVVGTKKIMGQSGNLIIYDGNTSAFNSFSSQDNLPTVQQYDACITGVNIKLAGIDGGIGFHYCYNLTDCTVHVASGLGDSTKLYFGFNGCYLLTKCRSRGWGTTSNYNPNTGQGNIGVGFLSCRGLFQCAPISVLGSSGNSLIFKGCYAGITNDYPVSNTPEGGWNYGESGV